MTMENDLAEVAKQAWQDAINERGRVNVLIAGRTGVGKSTLINAVFQGDLATTGQGRPVTQQIREIRKEGLPLSIFDTRGLEMAEYRQTLVDLEKLLKERKGEEDASRHIHVGWVCVAEDLRRVEDGEIKVAELLASVVPTIGVITKARSDQGWRAEVQRHLPSTKVVVRVRALQETMDDGHVLPPMMGLEELMDATLEVVPEGHRNAFAAAQKASMKIKRNRGHAAVATAAGAAAVIGASPIPFADAAVLVPVQIGMLARITVVFGAQVDKAFLMHLITSLGGTATATLVGRTVVANLIKLIPGAGTLIGGVISSTTAAAITTGLGEAYLAALAMLMEKSGGEPPTATEIEEALKRELKRRSEK